MESDINLLRQLLEAVRFRTYFDCLGLEPDCTTSEVRRAYERVKANIERIRRTKTLSKEAKDQIEEVRLVLEDAYEVLSNPDKRVLYRKALEGKEV